jgi:nitrogen regulatory protein PII
MTSQCSHVTIIINASLLKKLLFHLNELGINHLYSLFGRSLQLNEGRGFFRNMFFTSDLISESVDVLTFYLPKHLEEPVMKYVIKKMHLDVPGRGSIFSRDVVLHNGAQDELLCSVDQSQLQDQDNLGDTPLFDNLTQILCTTSKGLADELGKVLLHLGVVPTVTNASGTGLRDQLGLLRITIPKEKELLSVVVGPNEAGSIMDKMISWAKLDRPGRGFIWQVPIHKGVVNFKISQRTIGQAASTEQIIAAIDSIKGDFSWRQSGGTISEHNKRRYYKGSQLIIQVKEGASRPIVKAIMGLGISGATVQPLRSLSPEKDNEHLVVPQEIIRVVVDEKRAEEVIEMAVKEFEVQDDPNLKMTHVFSLPVIRAFNYFTPS